MRIFKAVCILFVLLAGLSLSARALGHAQPPNPALRGFVEGCHGMPQPCWGGIVPGVSTAEEVRALMAYAGPGRTLFDDLTESYYMYFAPPEPSPFCVVGFQLRGGRIMRALLQACPETDIHIGDLTGIFGMPQRTVMSPPRNLAYGSVVINTIGWKPPSSPFSEVHFINLLLLSNYDAPSFGWHGFVPDWRFCQLESRYPGC